jgi:hypothetical protein
MVNVEGRSTPSTFSYPCRRPSIHLLCRLVFALTSKHQREIADAGQRVGMLDAQHLLICGAVKSSATKWAFEERQVEGRLRTLAVRAKQEAPCRRRDWGRLK